MYKIEDIVIDCILKWGMDKNTENFLDKTKNWLNPIDKAHQEIFLKLLSHFNYYTMQSIYDIFRELYEKRIKEIDNYANSIYLPMLTPEGRLNHSFDMISCFQNANNIDKICFPVDIETVIREYPLEKISNVFFIDDMIGSGNTLEKSLDYIINKYGILFKKNIFIILIEACEDGLEIIEKINQKYGIAINILFWNLHKKAFKEEYIFNSKDCKSVKEICSHYENIVTNYNQNFVLGYNCSEALMAFYYNTPNNTLSTFWHNNKNIDWSPLFPRRKTFTPDWGKDLKKKRKAQGALNYNLKRVINQYEF